MLFNLDFQKIILLIIVPFILILCGSCNKKNKCDSTYADITISSKYDSAFVYKMRALDSLLGLNDIRCSSDSIEIRVNFYYGNLKRERLLVFNFNRDNNRGFYYNLSVDQSNGAPILESKREMSIYPQCGWLPFIDTLIQYRIFKLRTDDVIPEWRIGVHDNGWVVRYKEGNDIRIYSHYSFAGNAKYQSEAADVLRIIDLFERQLTVIVSSSE